MPDDEFPVPGPRPHDRRPAYDIEWDPSAARALRKLERQVARRIALKVTALGQEPRPRGAKALAGSPAGVMRIRVGDYRVVYKIEDARLIVLALGHRRDIYRNLGL